MYSLPSSHYPTPVESVDPLGHDMNGSPVRDSPTADCRAGAAMDTMDIMDTVEGTIRGSGGESCAVGISGAEGKDVTR